MEKKIFGKKFFGKNFFGKKIFIEKKNFEKKFLEKKICIGPIIRIGREIRCLPYAGFFFFTNTISLTFWARMTINIKKLSKKMQNI